jgi:hypothetical protein
MRVQGGSGFRKLSPTRLRGRILDCGMAAQPWSGPANLVHPVGETLNRHGRITSSYRQEAGDRTLRDRPIELSLNDRAHFFGSQRPSGLSQDVEDCALDHAHP